jgi:tRNA modification GTPase
MALVEAAIDFADEGDVPANLVGPALDTVAQLAEQIEEMLATSSHGERLREGLVVAITGPPNVGKSSLLNRIARRDAAIVSPVPGTTRDVIEVHLDLAGYPVTLLDTAGIHDSSDPIEEEGIRRARARAAEADLVLWITEANKGTAKLPPTMGGPGGVAWVVANKCDLVSESETEQLNREMASATGFLVSAHTGAGLEPLLAGLTGFAQEFFGSAEPALVTRERQRRLLQDAVSALRRALAEGKSGREEVVAEELRVAAAMLGRLLGRVDVEDVLDVIFRDFCIGK